MKESQRISGPHGIALHVEVRGRGHPLLLLHGFGGSVEAWGDRVLAGLAEHHRVIAVDLPGHGKSDTPTDPARYAIESLVEGLAHLLGELSATRAHWIGYSMGGRVALAAAVLAPERVQRLVLEGASPGLADEADRRARRERDEGLARRIEEGGSEAFVAEWEALPLFASQRRLPAVVQSALRERRLGNDPGALAACLRGLGTGTQPSFWDRLAEVRAPALLVTGEEDVKFTDIAVEMTRTLPESRHVVIPSAGHTVHLESPDAWLEAVTSWVT